MAWHETPDLVPVLSRGKHRSPRKGACFMEFASYLAGEKWSDHPSCTHPLLAQLARGVNDQISDEGRHDLVPLIPSVVGLTGDDPGLDVGIALRCAAVALPVAAHDRQRALAAGMLAAERLRGRLEIALPAPAPTRDLSAHAQRALSSAPLAARWARRFIADIDLDLRTFRRVSAPNIVRLSVLGIAEACTSDRDGLLRSLLITVIDDCASALGTDCEQGSARASATVRPAPATSV